MLQLKITIETINAAFDSNPEAECARILREIADRLETTGAQSTPRPRDINGNVCGSIEVVEA